MMRVQFADGSRSGRDARRAFGRTGALADGTRQEADGHRAPVEAGQGHDRGKGCADREADGSRVGGHIDCDGDERENRGETSRMKTERASANTTVLNLFETATPYNATKILSDPIITIK